MLTNFNDLAGKNCVITGGAGILGSVLAEGFARCGCNVVIADYNEQKSIEVAAEIKEKTGANVIGVFTNVLDKQALVETKKIINDKFGKIDILINGAGGNAPTATTQYEWFTEENVNDLSKGFFGLDIDGFKKVFDLNFIGTVLPTMVFTEDMLTTGGNIINISSMNAFRPLTKIPAYSAAKAGINNLTEWLAVHFAKLNIRVNAIAPGFFITDQNRFLLIDKETNEFTPRANKIIAGTPMGKFGDAEDLIGASLFLASEISKFVTGVIIPVDGGFNAYSGV